MELEATDEADGAGACSCFAREVREPSGEHGLKACRVREEMGRELADMSQVVAVMLVIISLGLLTDRAFFGVLEARVRERWGTATA